MKLALGVFGGERGDLFRGRGLEEECSRVERRVGGVLVLLAQPRLVLALLLQLLLLQQYRVHIVSDVHVAKRVAEKHASLGGFGAPRLVTRGRTDRRNVRWHWRSLPIIVTGHPPPGTRSLAEISNSGDAVLLDSKKRDLHQ